MSDITSIDESLASIKTTLINCSTSRNQEKKSKRIIYQLEQKIQNKINQDNQNYQKCIKMSEEIIEQQKKLISDQSKKLSEQSDKLLEQSILLQEQKLQMDKYSDLIKIKSEKEAYRVMDKIRDIGTDFVAKIAICRSLLKYMKKDLNITGGIVGSFVRQMMELPFLMKDIYKITDDDMIGFGNPIDHDVDIVLVKEVYNKESIRNKIIKMMNSINDEVGKLKFGDYIVSEIVDVTITNVLQSDPIGKQHLLNVPHYQIRLDRSDTDIDNLDSNLVVVLGDTADENNVTQRSIIIDIIGWYPEQDKNYYNPHLTNCNITSEMWPVVDFDVNSLMMEKNGFHIKSMLGKVNTIDLFDIFENIEKRRAKCLIDLQGLHKQMVCVSDVTSKLICLKQLSFFIGNRMKILSNGYNKVIGNIPDYGIEEKEECHITHCSPPYLVYKLECGHDFSSVALMSSMQKNVSDNFNFVCHKCRKDFKLKFSEFNKMTNTISLVANSLEKPEKPENSSDDLSSDDMPPLEEDNELDVAEDDEMEFEDDELPPLEDVFYKPQKPAIEKDLQNKKILEEISKNKPVSTVGTDRSKLKAKYKQGTLLHDPSYS